MVKNNIRLIRMESGLLQRKLAQLAGTSQAHISRIEWGVYRPCAEDAHRIATALKVPVEDLGYDVSTLRPYTTRTSGDGRARKPRVKADPWTRFWVRLFRRLSL